MEEERLLFLLTFLRKITPMEQFTRRESVSQVAEFCCAKSGVLMLRVWRVSEFSSKVQSSCPGERDLAGLIEFREDSAKQNE